MKTSPKILNHSIQKPLSDYKITIVTISVATVTQISFTDIMFFAII